MSRIPLKEWAPPPHTEVYTETFKPSERVKTREYKQHEGDMFVLIAEYPVRALTTEQTWKEAMRAAKAIVKCTTMKNIVVMHFPAKRVQLERVRIFRKYSLEEFDNSRAKAGETA